MPFVAPNFLSRQYRSRVQPCEWVMILYCFAMMLVVALFRARIPGWSYYLAGHGLLILTTALLVGAESKAGRFVRAFDMCVTIPVVFFMACALIHRVHPTDYDPQLIAIDRSIGGVALMRWMKSMESSTLTRLSQGAWMSYYFIALIPGVALYRRPHKQGFEEAKLIFMLGWLLSYAGYFLVPAEGPGYHEAEVGSNA
jgi:hypothetical protein